MMIYNLWKKIQDKIIAGEIELEWILLQLCIFGNQDDINSTITNSSNRKNAKQCL